MIPVLDAKSAEHIRLPLWSDPAIQEANTEEALAEFISSGDPSVLKVPDDATIVVIKALSAKEMALVSRRAGRVPHLGTVMAMRKANKRNEIVENSGDLDEEVSAIAFAKWLDGLDSDEANALVEYEQFEEKKNELLVIAGTLKVEHTNNIFDNVSEFLEMVISPLVYDSIVSEIAYRIRAYSCLGTRPKGLSDSACGLQKQLVRAEEPGTATPVQAS